MGVMTAIHIRRSIRAYRPEPLPRALMEDLLWAAVQAPTPPISGDAPWALCVIEGVQRIADLGARAKRYVSTSRRAAVTNGPTGRPLGCSGMLRSSC